MKSVLTKIDVTSPKGLHKFYNYEVQSSIDIFGKFLKYRLFELSSGRASFEAKDVIFN